jgi:hypothetical protein
LDEFAVDLGVLEVAIAPIANWNASLWRRLRSVDGVIVVYISVSWGVGKGREEEVRNRAAKGR